MATFHFRTPNWADPTSTPARGKKKPHQNNGTEERGQGRVPHHHSPPSTTGADAGPIQLDVATILANSDTPRLDTNLGITGGVGGVGGLVLEVGE